MYVVPLGIRVSLNFILLFVNHSNLVFQRATFQNFTRTIKIGLVVSLNSPAPSSNNNDNDNNNNKIHIFLEEISITLSGFQGRMPSTSEVGVLLMSLAL